MSVVLCIELYSRCCIHVGVYMLGYRRRCVDEVVYLVV